ncbi:MAG: hypothetical protein A3F41_04145 [Coxiella sp. RIFCSPHIGHO2_12_FULL_44_14]|nr:MAG: hypothetical protein A3F41_04145 [Coxiella sp. RIFCSPHIGHO2_12_FULL_44_14]
MEKCAAKDYVVSFTGQTVLFYGWSSIARNPSQHTFFYVENDLTEHSIHYETGYVNTHNKNRNKDLQ